MRFQLVTPDAARLARFYRAALGFRASDARSCSASDLGSDSDAQSVTLRLGRESVDLLQFDRPGRPYPATASASDLCFQHFAIVVADMALAYRRLCSVSGWSAISTDGPQRLPPSSGGVTAFKFRDPDGHPLELLAFPDGKIPPQWQARPNGTDFALGIDHSAIGVADSARSIAFYAGLGLKVTARSLNRGCEQARLDGVSRPQVEVTALSPCRGTPHVELLCYRSATPQKKIDLRCSDVAATRLIFEVGRDAEDSGNRQSLVDPDGHHLVIVGLIESKVPSITKPAADAAVPSASAKPE